MGVVPARDVEVDTAAAALRRVKALLHSPERWTQWTAARDEAGDIVGASSEMATCWCPIGATLHEVDGVENPDLLSEVMSLLGTASWTRMKTKPRREGHPSKLVSLYNDAPRRKWEDIIEMIDLAIELAEKE